jgi:hypothetical protein
MITDRERDVALGLLTRSRQVLLEAVEGLSENQARWKSEPGRWTILEYVEHLAVSDDELVALVKRALLTPPQEETEDERRQREKGIAEKTPIPRGVNRAPERLQPRGRFANLPEAVSAFLAARERTLEFARTTRDDLRKHFAPHPVLGPMDGYQWLVANARHVELHSGHIREIRLLAGFPRE